MIRTMDQGLKEQLAWVILFMGALLIGIFDKKPYPRFPCLIMKWLIKRMASRLEKYMRFEAWELFWLSTAIDESLLELNSKLYDKWRNA